MKSKTRFGVLIIISGLVSLQFGLVMGCHNMARRSVCRHEIILNAGGMPPVSVLSNAVNHLKDLRPGMSKAQVFVALGLGDYSAAIDFTPMISVDGFMCDEEYDLGNKYKLYLINVFTDIWWVGIQVPGSNRVICKKLATKAMEASGKIEVNSGWQPID